MEGTEKKMLPLPHFYFSANSAKSANSVTFLKFNYEYCKTLFVQTDKKRAVREKEEKPILRGRKGNGRGKTRSKNVFFDLWKKVYRKPQFIRFTDNFIYTWIFLWIYCLGSGVTFPLVSFLNAKKKKSNFLNENWKL